MVHFVILKNKNVRGAAAGARWGRPCWGEWVCGCWLGLEVGVIRQRGQRGSDDDELGEMREGGGRFWGQVKERDGERRG